MTIQFSKRQSISIQILFWLLVGTFSFWPIEWSFPGMPTRMPPFPNHGLHLPKHPHEMLQSVVNNLMIITLFYTNYLYLIPQYYLKGNKGRYAVFAMLFVLLIASIPLLFELVHHHFHFSLGPREFHKAIINLLAASLAIIVPLAFKISSQYAESEREKTKAELSFLRSQINHHFLFNSLNNIYSLSIQESKHTSEAIYSLSAIMRHLATATATNKIDLQQEIDFLQHYIEIQKLRLSENTKLTYEIHGDAANKKIGPMLLIPFIENCFKHGVSTSVKSEIIISLNIGEKEIILQTKNNMIEHLNKENIKSGVGLGNVSKRLEYEYAGHYECNQSVENGYYVSNLKMDLI